MSFENLSLDLQNVLIHNYNSFGKLFLFIVIVGFSIYYLKFVRPTRKLTPFFTSLVLRILLDSFCFVSIVLSPLMILFFSPEYSFWNMFLLYFSLYTIGMTFYLFLIGIDILRYGVIAMFKMGGLDLNDKRANLVAKKFEGYVKELRFK